MIADDHGIVRSGVKLLLDRQDDMEVVAEAEDGVDAVAQVVEHRPDVAILDVSMPRMTGLQATHEIKQQSPDTQVLILSMHDDQRYLFEALRAGASGYVLKAAADQDLVDAVRAASRGEPFLTSGGPAGPDPRLPRPRRRAGDADAARAGGREADRRGAHEPRDRRDPPPLGEDRRVAPRRASCRSSACATAWSWCATRSAPGLVEP